MPQGPQPSEPPISSLNELQKVLDKLTGYSVSEGETNIFQIGGRGHYENPTTQLLAFFLDPRKQHAFSDQILNIFIDTIREASSFGQSVFPDHLSDGIDIQTEVQTSQGNRIDLVLGGADWVIAVENKIRHWAANPFEDYDVYVNSLNKKCCARILLSINQEATPDGWIPLRWNVLLSNIRQRIGPLLLSGQDYGKWPTLLREFLLNVEGECRLEIKMDGEKFEFAKINYSKLVEAEKLRSEFIESLAIDWNTKLRKDINFTFQEIEGKREGKWSFAKESLTPIRFIGKGDLNDFEFVLKVWDSGLFGINFNIFTQLSDGVSKLRSLLPAGDIQGVNQSTSNGRKYLCAVGFDDKDLESAYSLALFGIRAYPNFLARSSH